MSSTQQLILGEVPAAGGYQIERSLRFNSADSAYLNRTTTSSVTSNTTWTFSFWAKFSSSTTGSILGGSSTGSAGSAYSGLRFDSGAIEAFQWTGSAYDWRKTSTQVFRDFSSWYHIVFVGETGNATAEDRIKLYVNNVRITSFSTNTNPSSSTAAYFASASKLTRLGVSTVSSPSDYLNGYLTEINFIDGQALTPSSFGQNNASTGVWEPVKYTGTYGTNGFYLNFSDNSNTTSTTLGKDYSGNGNNWTPNLFSVTAGTGNDSLVDTPTSYGTDTGVGGEVRGNYCTMNPLDSKNGTASNGNLLWTATASQSDIRGTFAIPASGKWYIECTVGSTTNASSAVSFGLATSSVALDASNAVTGLYQLYASSSGFLSLNGTNVSSSLGTWTAGDVLQIAVDVDNTKMWLGKNNTWYNSTGGTTGDPSTGANATSTTSMVGLFPFSNCYQNNATWNAGQRAFSYTAPSGFKALCTQNLPTPTIGATSTTQAGKYFNTVLYTGTGSARSVTGVGFQPDFVWVKTRSVADNHNNFDAVRGAVKRLFSNLTNAEDTTAGTLTSFDSDGFSLGSNLDMNTNGVTLVAWNWKANGAGSSNTAGSITSTVSANTTSGFSIATYTGNGTGGATVGHGLGVSPSWIIIKSRSNATNWMVWTDKLTTNYALEGLNTTGAEVSGGSPSKYIRAVSSTTFTIGNDVSVNQSASYTYVAYCFAPVAGYSAFGSYTGNGSATDGTFVYTGFRPRWILVKNSGAVGSWCIYDAVRNAYNLSDARLNTDNSNAEAVSSTQAMDIVSNGFKLKSSNTDQNGSSNTYIYAAFAENPFKYSLAR